MKFLDIAFNINRKFYLMKMWVKFLLKVYVEADSFVM